jgi:hypothetical protein
MNKFPLAVLLVAAALFLSAHAHAATPDQCRASHLRISTFNDGIESSLGHFAVVYETTNNSHFRCTLSGTPNVRLLALDGIGHPVNLAICANCQDPLFDIAPIKDIVLRRNETAYFFLGFAVGDAPGHLCGTLSQILLSLGGDKPLSLDVGSEACDKVNVGAWQAGPFDTDYLDTPRH